ncbi:hypothetical protein HYU06_05435, partial [Candidatus Woesearchaeota archaeon]|nr:hypothetical protein [Candidatus Woesearchaeota archaeon]
NNAATSVGVITVSDTIVPVFTTGVASQTKEFALQGVSQNIAATDAAIITYSVNDTNFSINGAGLLINATQLAVRLYNVKITATDASNNAATSTGVITVSDTTLPVWTTAPSNQNINLTQSFTATVTASDTNTPITYSINDTANFTINAATGEIRNNTELTADTYNLLVTAKDNSNNAVTGTMRVIVGNDPPTITGLTDAAKTEDFGLIDNLIDLHAFANDLNTAVNLLTFSITSQSNNSVVNCVIDGNRFVDCITLANMNGASDVTIRVTDPQTAFAEDTFRLTITAVNDAPTVTATALTPVLADTNTLFTCTGTGAADAEGDTLANKYQFEDGSGILQAFGASNTLDCSAVVGCDKNDAITCKYKVNDGTVDSNIAASSSVTVQNTAPTIASASLTPAAPNTNSVLTCTANTVNDVDTDTVTLSYQFEDGSGTLQAFSAAATLDCGTVAGCDNGDTITCKAKGNDGTADSNIAASTGVLVGNSPPTVTSSSLTPASPNTNSVITCTGFGANDPDGQALTHSYQFKSNVAVIQAFSATNTLDCSAVTNCDKADSITCEYKVNDGTFDSNVVASIGVAVSNSAPSVANAALTPTTSNTNTLFTCAGSGSNDADGDALSNLYQFKDAAGILQAFSATAAFNCGSAAGCDLGDAITCEYKANDGTTDSNIAASNSVNIIDMPDLIVEQLQVRSPVAPTTATDTLIKFIIRNIGNVDAGNIQWKLDFQDGIHTQPDTPTIKAGEFLLVYDYVRFTAAGMHTLTATADQNNAINELDETNNAQSIQKNVS